jgi:aspartate kinase
MIDDRRARAVVAEKNVVLGKTSAPLAALAAAAAEANVAPKEVAFGPSGGSFVVPLLNVPDWRAAKPRLAALPDAQLVEGCALVSVVGDGLGPAEVSAALGALTGAGIEVLAMSASPLRVGAIVAEGRAADAERALHAALVT